MAPKFRSFLEYWPCCAFPMLRNFSCRLGEWVGYFDYTNLPIGRPQKLWGSVQSLKPLVGVVITNKVKTLFHFSFHGDFGSTPFLSHNFSKFSKIFLIRKPRFLNSSVGAPGFSIANVEVSKYSFHHCRRTEYCKGESFADLPCSET